jgi:hypothetical protein
LKKPLATLALAAAAAVTLAVPAGASTPATTWVHQTLHCAGRKTATMTYKMQGGAAIDSWVDNRCGHQWVTITTCGPENYSTRCNEVDVWPKTKFHTGPMGYDPTASLMLGAGCGDQGPVLSCDT